MSWTLLPLYFQPYTRGQSSPVRFIVKGQGTVGGNWGQEAYDWAAGTLPQVNGDLQFLQSLSLDKMLGWDESGNQFFELTANYGPAAASESPEQAVVAGRANDEAHATLISARMYGVESRLEVAEVVHRYSLSGADIASEMPNHGLIIKTADGVGVPALEVAGDFTLQKRLPKADVSDYLKDVLEPLISPRPRMNNATFWGRPAGSVLLVDYDLNFDGGVGVINGHFNYKPNLSSATVAGISGVTANGHDHLEAFYKTIPASEGGKTYDVKTLFGFYVYQLYKTGDFSTLKMTEA